MWLAWLFGKVNSTNRILYEHISDHEFKLALFPGRMGGTKAAWYQLFVPMHLFQKSRNLCTFVIVGKNQICIDVYIQFTSVSLSWKAATFSHVCRVSETFNSVQACFPGSWVSASASPLCLHRSSSCVGKPSPLSTGMRSTHTDEKAMHAINPLFCK